MRMPNTIDYTKIFHTVPMSSNTLERMPNGTKTNPGFPQNWIQFQSKRNTSNTAVLGAIARQDFIGIDIDNSPLFKQALVADNDTAEYVSESDLKGGHLLYSFNEEDYHILKSISKQAKEANVDIQIDNKLIYLATEANKTKQLLTEPLTSLPKTRIPQNVINLIYAHILKHQIANPHIKQAPSQTSSDYNPNALDNSTLGYLLEKQEYEIKDLLTILPKSIEPKHPKDIEEGAGTDWMRDVRFKLSQDPSISENDFKRFMLYLNTLWDNPMSESRVLSDCKYDIDNGLNKLTGDPLWRYNDKWKEEGYKFSNKSNHIVEVMFDSEYGIYVEHNKVSDKVTTYDQATKVLDRIHSTSRDRKVTKKDKLIEKSQSITLVNTPEKLRGKIPGEYNDILFNLFNPSEGANILSGATVVKEPRHPATILRFLEHMIPDEGNRVRLMQFLAYKHTTYEHSELYFVFAGASGAGKNVLINTILTYFSGLDRMEPAGLDKLTIGFNSWMGTQDYIVIDEAGEGSSKKEQEKLVGTLKNMTGSATFSPSRKGKDISGIQIRHYMTPLLTTNMETKLVTDTSKNDRRLVLFKSPVKLTHIVDDTREFINKMENELPHFANYLLTLPKISYGDYRDNRNWKNKDYEEYIQATISPMDRLSESLESSVLQDVLDVLMDFGVHKRNIDSMFEVSIPKTPRFILYHTSNSIDCGLQSLVDVLAEVPYFRDSDVLNKLKKFATVRGTYTKGEVTYRNIRMVPLTGIYTPLNVMPGINPIEEIEID